MDSSPSMRERPQALSDGAACLEAAMLYLSLGWSPLALCSPDHIGTGKQHNERCKSPGKAPWGTWKDFQDRQPTEVEVLNKFRDNPTLNVGMAMGPVGGIIGIDVDGPAGEELLQKMSSGDLPETLEFTTPGGGRRLFYKMPPGVKFKPTYQHAGGPHEEVRFLGYGAQTVMPPSRHANGGMYEWKAGHGPKDREATYAPRWIIRKMRDDGPSTHGKPKVFAGSVIPEGQRDSILTSYAGSMRRKGMVVDEIQAALLVMNNLRCRPALEDDQVLKIAQSVGRYEPQDVPKEFYTDLDEKPFSRVKPVPGEFPVAAYPVVVQQFVLQAADSISCPIDFVAAPILAVASIAIGMSRSIVVKKDFLQSPSVYMVVVGEPGSAKTPALDLVVKPIQKIQEQLASDFGRDKDSYETELTRWEHDRKQVARSGGSLGSKPIPPVFKRTYTTDCTVESLAPILADNVRGMGLVMDELTALVMGMNQYKAGGKGNDRQFYLKTWNNQNIVVDRRGNIDKVPTIVNRPFLTVIGGIQPDMLNSLIDEKRREDGFTHRLLYAYPERMPMAPWQETTIADDVLDQWRQIVHNLFAVQMRQRDDGSLRPYYCKMNKDAREGWRYYHNRHIDETKHKDFEYVLLGPWSKFINYAARFALIVHCLRVACGDILGDEVDDTDIVAGWSLVDYFKSHARKVYQVIHKKADDRQAEIAYEWIMKHGGECSVRDIQRHGVCGVQKSSEAHKLLTLLKDSSMGDFFDVERGGKTTTRFLLNQSYWSVGSDDDSGEVAENQDSEPKVNDDMELETNGA